MKNGCNLVVNVPVKFEVCDDKIEGRVGFLVDRFFFSKEQRGTTWDNSEEPTGQTWWAEQ